ncbi:DNA polymerase I [bacterium]|nr:DNA polymerase I [candidate division CSSED10-310 bacterium]
MAKKAYLIDGHNLLYRAHFVFIKRPLITTKGKNTSVLYGMAAMLRRVLKDFSPEYAAVVFDRPEPTFRKLEYQDYKKDRLPMPVEIQQQLPEVKELIDALGLTILEKPGFEADDVIGTASARLTTAGFDVVVFSGDKDLLQLVDDRTTVYVNKSGMTEFEIFNAAAVEAKYGVPPARIVDWLALCGDKVDNIPGVDKVGPKTATSLLQTFGTTEMLLERLNEVASESLRARISEARDDVELGKFLAAIKRDVPLEFEPADLRRRDPDTVVLRGMYQENEFRAFLVDLQEAATVEDRSYSVVASLDELDELVARIQRQKWVVFDLETTSVDPVRARLVGIALALEAKQAYYIPVGHREGIQLDMTEVRKRLAPVLADEGIGKIGHNIKYDWLVSERCGMPLRGVHFDTMVASYLLEPMRRQHNLDALSLDHLGVTKIPTVAIIGRKTGIDSMDFAPIETVAEYACEDADMTLRLYELFNSKLAERDQYLFSEVEMPLIEVLKDMEKTGIRVREERLRDLSVELGTRVLQLQEDLYAEAGEEFNLNSPKQLNKILFEKLKYPTRGLRKTSHGWSTDEDSLHRLVRADLQYRQLPELLLEYRGLSKLLSTYIESLPRLINPVTRRIHTSYNQTVTDTGRLSSSDPNLQNIPIKGEWGPKIREAFVPGEDGWLLFSADYSQIELRIMAHVAGDEGLVELFRRGCDIHAATAGEVFGIAPEEVTPDHRRMAKTINFGIMYGMNEYGLSQRLGIDVPDARRYIDLYFERYPGVSRYIAETCEAARRDGFVTTILGRRRMLPDINDRRRNIREAACRRAINMPIQGSAADLIKLAMIAIHRRIARDGLATKLLLQVHDELVFETPPEEQEILKAMVHREMEGAMSLTVPLVVQSCFGASWREIH